MDAYDGVLDANVIREKQNILLARKKDIEQRLKGAEDPAEYKHVVLGLIFLKYISDSFGEVYRTIKADPDSYKGQEEDKDVPWVSDSFACASGTNR